MSTTSSSPSEDTDYYENEDNELMKEDLGEADCDESQLEELTDEEKECLCRAFTLLDTDADGVINPEQLHQLLISWGRMPMDDELKMIMSHAHGISSEGVKGMDFQGFETYMKKHLTDTRDEDSLRKAFQVFDSTPPAGKLNVVELRHYLKYTGLKLTDDEIDFLFKEEDYWMLEEKSIFEYEHLISKILDKPNCDSQFLNC